MPLYTVPRGRSKLDILAGILGKGIGGYQQGKEQKRQIGRQERLDPLKEELMRAQTGQAQRANIPKATDPIQQAMKELQFWQERLKKTYKTGIMGEMGELMPGQEATNKLIQENIVRVRRRLMESLGSGQLSLPTSPTPSTAKPTGKSIRKRLAEAFGFGTAKPVPKKAEAEPQTLEAFEAKVAEINNDDPTAAKAYYNKWIGKWQ